jgi:hypothetical protein
MIRSGDEHGTGYPATFCTTEGKSKVKEGKWVQSKYGKREGKRERIAEG